MKHDGAWVEQSGGSGKIKRREFVPPEQRGNKAVKLPKVQEGGAFEYTIDGINGKETRTIQQINGVGYILESFGKPPEIIGDGIDANELAQRVTKNGGEVKVISAKVMRKREKAYQQSQKNKPDYEFNLGTPWGNRGSRKRARLDRLQTRATKRKY